MNIQSIIKIAYFFLPRYTNIGQDTSDANILNEVDQLARRET